MKIKKFTEFNQKKSISVELFWDICEPSIKKQLGNDVTKEFLNHVIYDEINIFFTLKYSHKLEEYDYEDIHYEIIENSYKSNNIKNIINELLTKTILQFQNKLDEEVINKIKNLKFDFVSIENIIKSKINEYIETNFLK